MSGQPGPATPPEERARIKKKIAEGPFGRKRKPDTRLPLPRWEVVSKARGKYFFEYWKSIPQEFVDLVEVRSYRTWPQIRMELAEPERKDHAWEIIEGACPFDPEDFETQIMQRPTYGSGDYRFDLKERGVPDIICRGYVHAQDLQMYPPVLDYSTLVNCPANQEYIRTLMKRNIKLPWEYTPEEENEMAGTGAGVAESLKLMTEAVTTTAKMAVESAHEAANAKVEAAEARLDEANNQEEDDSPPDEVAESAAIRGFDLLAHAAEKSMDMMTKYAGKQYDPVEMMKATKELMKGDGAGIELLVGAIEKQGTLILQMAEKNQELMRETLKAPAASTKSMLEQVKEIKEFADLFGWGPRDHDDEPAPVVQSRAPEKSAGQIIAENISTIIPGLSMIMAMGANIFYNMKATTPRNPAEDMAAAMAQNPLAQMPPGTPPQQFAQPAPPAPVDPAERYRGFIRAITDPLLHHFFGGQAGFNGYTFAEYILSNKTGAGETLEGRQAYVTIKTKLGRDQFDQLVREHFDLWSKLQGMPQQWKGFLDEFFGYDEWAAKQSETAAAA